MKFWRSKEWCQRNQEENREEEQMIISFYEWKVVKNKNGKFSTILNSKNKSSQYTYLKIQYVYIPLTVGRILLQGVPYGRRNDGLII